MADDRAVLEIVAKVDQALQGIESVQAQLKTMTGSGSSGATELNSKMLTLRDTLKLLATGLAAVKIKEFFVESLEQAAEAQDAFAEVTRLIKSTGGAAHLTAEQLKETAGQLAAISVYDDDEILAKTTATLLRFGSLSGETFKRAQRDAVDLAATLHIDLASAAEIVGKALLSPGEGLRALKQAGVDFTATETTLLQKWVETGKAADAQAATLDRLEKATANAARTNREQMSGSLQAMKRDLGEVQQAFGEGFAKQISEGADEVTSSLRGIGPAAKDAGTALGALLDWGSRLVRMWPALSAGVSSWVGTLLSDLSKGAAAMLSFEETVAKVLGAFGGPVGAAIGARFVKAAEEVRNGPIKALAELGEQLQVVGVEKMKAFADSFDTVEAKATPALAAVATGATTASDKLAAAAAAADAMGTKIVKAAETAAEALKKLRDQQTADEAKQQGRDALGPLNDPTKTGGPGNADEANGIRQTIDALKAKQEQGALTADELANLFDAEDQLHNLQPKLAQSMGPTNSELEKLGGTVGDLTGKLQPTAAELDRLANALENAGTPLIDTQQSLGDLAQQTKAAREQLGPAVETMDNVGSSAGDMAKQWLAAGAGVHEVGKQSEGTREAIDNLAGSTDKLKDKRPDEMAKEWARQMGAVKEEFAWLNSGDGLPTTIQLASTLHGLLKDLGE